LKCTRPNRAALTQQINIICGCFKDPAYRIPIGFQTRLVDKAIDDRAQIFFEEHAERFLKLASMRSNQLNMPLEHMIAMTFFQAGIAYQAEQKVQENS
jgi:hypothetical protein